MARRVRTARWETGILVNRADQIPPGSSWRLPALAEMVKIDLERQWARGQEISLESYLEQYPELGRPDNVSADLIRAEYEVRKQFGAPISLDDYMRRFPHQAAELGRLIAQGNSSLRHRLSASDPPRSSTFQARRSTATPEPFPRPFGRYRLLKRLGEGGMGSVYLAEDTTLGRPVALKIPLFGAEESAEGRERFYREARAAATLDHPYLCPVYDVGEIDGKLYLTMAYIEGKSLAESLRGEGLPPRQVAALVGKLALALEAAHARGVIHRDLKPANVMIKASGQRREPVIVDFGLARRDDADAVRVTKTGQVMGTLGYMAPEQVRGDKAIGPACDIYALGVMLYELLTGRLPFSGSGLAVAGQILTQDPLPPSEHRPEIDPRLEAICLKAMARKIEDRYASMGALAAALTDFLKAASTTSTPGMPAPPKTGDTPQESGSNSLVGKFFDQLAAANVPDRLPSAQSREPVAFASRKSRSRLPRWIWPAVTTGVLLFGLVVAWGVVLRVRTSNGTIELVNLPRKAQVFVDGEEVSVTWPGGGKPAVVTATAGKHKVKVKKDGLETTGDEVTVQAGETQEFTVRFVSLADARPGKDDGDDRPAHSSVGSTGDLPTTSTQTTKPADGFQSLFNGKDLSGWFVGKGDRNDWRVEDGHLVVTGSGDFRRQGFLLTERDYSDFLLRFDFHLPKGADSGVMVRAAQEDLPLGLEVNLRQPEVDHALPGALRWMRSGGGRDYLHPYRQAELRPEGNLERDGNRGARRFPPRLHQWSGGVAYRSGQARRTAGAQPNLRRRAGRIGFQSHTGTVRFRNIVVKDLSVVIPAQELVNKPPVPPAEAKGAEGGFQPLFNGKDLTGWTIDGGVPESWRVDSGEIVVNGPGDYRRNGFLLTNHDYGDFLLRFEFQPARGPIAVWRFGRRRGSRSTA